MLPQTVFKLLGIWRRGYGVLAVNALIEWIGNEAQRVSVIERILC